jgi:hypothetical protein
MEMRSVERGSVERSTIEGSTTESSTIDGSSIEDSIIESSTIESSTIESGTIGSDTIEDSSIESSTIESSTIESSSSSTTPHTNATANVTAHVTTCATANSKATSASAGRDVPHWTPEHTDVDVADAAAKDDAVAAAGHTASGIDSNVSHAACADDDMQRQATQQHAAASRGRHAKSRSDHASGWASAVAKRKHALQHDVVVAQNACKKKKPCKLHEKANISVNEAAASLAVPTGGGKRRRVTRRDVGARWHEAARVEYLTTVSHATSSRGSGKAPISGRKRTRRKDGTGRGGEEGGEGVT